jgi:hypothetical protein
MPITIQKKNKNTLHVGKGSIHMFFRVVQVKKEGKLLSVNFSFAEKGPKTGEWKQIGTWWLTDEQLVHLISELNALRIGF